MGDVFTGSAGWHCSCLNRNPFGQSGFIQTVPDRAVGNARFSRSRMQGGRSRAAGSATRHDAGWSRADDLRKSLVVERLQGFCPDVTLRRQLSQTVQRLCLGVGGQDQDAVIIAQGPILTINFYTGACRRFGEVVGSPDGFLDVSRSLIGESQQTDVSGHVISLVEVLIFRIFHTGAARSRLSGRELMFECIGVDSQLGVRWDPASRAANN